MSQRIKAPLKWSLLFVPLLLLMNHLEYVKIAELNPYYPQFGARHSAQGELAVTARALVYLALCGWAALLLWRGPKSFGQLTRERIKSQGERSKWAAVSDALAQAHAPTGRTPCTDTQDSVPLPHLEAEGHAISNAVALLDQVANTARIEEERKYRIACRRWDLRPVVRRWARFREIRRQKVRRAWILAYRIGTVVLLLGVLIAVLSDRF